MRSEWGRREFELSPNGLKVRHAASYTTTPMIRSGYAFQSLQACLVLLRVVVVSGSPEDRTQHNSVSAGLDDQPSTTMLFQKSDTSESNRDPPAPKAGVLPSAPVSRYVRFRRRISSLSVGREALESSSAVLQTAARPSQLPAHVGLFWGCPMWTRKKARCLCDTEPSCRKQFA